MIPPDSETSVRIGIVTVSDRASRGEYEGRGGPAIHQCLSDILSCDWEPVARVIPDERPLIEDTLTNLCDRERCCLVVTTGGTGPARRLYRASEGWVMLSAESDARGSCGDASPR